ncbi:MAG: Ig-like domain-containing protein [Propionibacteriales bacterium]|nr:Ig-like domain-containing protein [Propionibacteriales bacterium]
MIGASLALKIAVPAVLAVGGVAAIVAVPDQQTVAAAPAQLWIDSPASTAFVAPGPVTVVAHAADELALDSMTLKVDGTDVATRDDLATYDRLASVTFTWNATDGEHVLVVTGGGKQSAPVAVKVGTATALGTPEPSRGPSARPSPTASATPTPTATASTTAAPTKAPTTKAPPADPQVLSVSVNPSSIGGDSCTQTITVTATVRNATGGSAQIVGDYGVDKFIGGTVKNNVFTATFMQNKLAKPDPGYKTKNITGSFRVEVTVTNANGFDVGAATFQVSCAKD